MGCCAECDDKPPTSCCQGGAAEAIDRLALALWLEDGDPDRDPVRGAMPAVPLAPGEIILLAERN